jgi:hypothetical protein
MSTDERQALLQDCGEALYGPQWQSAVARDLDVADRTVRRWIAGTTPVPIGIYAELAELVQTRTGILLALYPRLQRIPAKAGQPHESANE